MSSSYREIMERRSEILDRALGIDYGQFEQGALAFDYEGLLASTGRDLDEVQAIQRSRGVGSTPLLELHNITDLVRSISPAGFGARILVKDEAANPSGSFKDRRAALSAHVAAERGYRGVVAATSGNYGAAVASQAARSGLAAVIVQEAFDSRGYGQPEILEKARKCEALGAEVLQTTVGPELFSMLLSVLEDTGYFNASLYTPMSVQGIETLGTEIVDDVRALTGRDPAAVLATHAGGGMCTGVGRGLRARGAATQLVGVSVDLSGLHMASDQQFNRKSFTTGHTGFSVPFTTWPDRVDVPRNAARPLRYLDRLVTVSQGAVFHATELLAVLEGLERGPAGNTSLAAAVVVAQELPADEVIVISETEYTGAGKTPWSQLEFASGLGVEISTGTGRGTAGSSIVLPLSVRDVAIEDIRLDDLRASYVRTAGRTVGREFTDDEIRFLAEDSGWSDEAVLAVHRG
ncbi:2-amino-4-oxopentanoate thiolase subunit OrtB [Nocardioides sp.]|uniref:2-amino-4-oxopentanoate thiolase subunit OrtB n=1 Tax=Nocardioides sp. TaxID=35761 RepID=UPI00261DFB1E|nr:2-amino-4-oxopentanoate thiolase subunit OrtB [Nocardioides sp.]MDI6908570.1 2-amino-4-oxopentanoate thiolase subunit OrtB [Nocardioides sp.]